MRTSPWGWIILLSLLMLGCRDPKATGPEPLFPDNSMRLFFAGCDPLAYGPGLHDQITLVENSTASCNDAIWLYGNLPTWQSNAVLAEPGVYTEGFHLVFEEDSPIRYDSHYVHVSFQGIAVSIDTAFLAPPGDPRPVYELAATATLLDTVTAPRRLRLTVSGGQKLLATSSMGSWVSSDVDRSRLCRLKFLQQPRDGIGRPGIGTPYTLAYADGAVSDSLILDFTGGARLSDAHNSLIMGPRFGVAYVAAAAGGCRDTAAFWTLPSVAAFNVDTLGTWLNPPGRPLSDGTHVWFYDYENLPEGSATPSAMRVTDLTDVPFIWHPTFASENQITVHWDRKNRLIWIVDRSSTVADTAWGYSRQWHLDSTIVSPFIPNAAIYRGQWVYADEHDRLRREIRACALDGSGDHLLGVYPTELTEGFAGGAGLGYPGAGCYPYYSVNTFDEQGFWSSQQGIMNRSGYADGPASLLTADSIIVYALYGYNYWYWELRVLH